jgi:hypothetical protein
VRLRISLLGSAGPSKAAVVSRSVLLANAVRSLGLGNGCLVSLVLAGSLLPATPARGADSTALPVESVRVEITVSGAGNAAVREHFLFSQPVSLPEFRYLDDTCAVLSDVDFSSSSETIPVAILQPGAWVSLLLRDASQPVHSNLDVRYMVRLSGALPNVPLVFPASVLDSPGRNLLDVVKMQVMFPPGSKTSTILLPQMQRSRSDATVWEQSTVAIPSFLRMRLGAGIAQHPCTAGAATTIPTGSLEWWIAGFCTSLVIFVVVYMRWATGEPKGDG